MPSRRRSRLVLTSLSLMLTATLAACSDSDEPGADGPRAAARPSGPAAVDGAAFAAAFGAAADDEYRAQGTSRSGTTSDLVGTRTCFALDAPAVQALEDVLGRGRLRVNGEAVQGLTGEEELGCTVFPADADSADDLLLDVRVGTTGQTRDEFVAEQVERAPPPEDLDGPLGQLPPGDVAVFADPAFTRAFYVRDGVKIGVGAGDVLPQDVVLAALPVIVGEVARVFDAA